MNYEVIRAARLCHPFRPFFLRTVDGQVYFIREELHLVVSPVVVAIYDQGQDKHAILKPDDIEGILYTDQPIGTMLHGQ